MLQDFVATHAAVIVRRWHLLLPYSCSLQEFARANDHLTHFLTYADNNAVGYFAKQGFTKEITLEKDRVSLPPCPYQYEPSSPLS